MLQTRHFALLFAASGLATLGLTGSRPAEAQTVIIDGAFASGSPGTDLTALGTTDWAKWGYGTNPTTFINKALSSTNANPVGDISNVTAYSDGTNSSHSEINQNLAPVSWSDGSNASYLPSGSSSDGLYNGNFPNPANSNTGLGWTFDVIAPAQTTGTFYLYEGGYDSIDTLSVTSSDGTLPSFLNVTNVDGTGYFTASINNLAPTADTLHFTFYESASAGDYNNPKIEAAALALRPNAGLPSAAPEPAPTAALSLAAFGLSGLLFNAKSRAKSPAQVAAD